MTKATMFSITTIIILRDQFDSKPTAQYENSTSKIYSSFRNSFPLSFIAYATKII